MSEEVKETARESIYRLLLSAGYFRVRMTDLSDFDKITGGLAWGLKASSVDVEINVFTKERPNLGEMISISESVCKGLIAAKCPYAISAIQLTGLDYPHLFPVFQWLVRRVLETRAELGDFQRSYAEYSFRSKYSMLPSDMEIEKNKGEAEGNLRNVERFFAPRRIYKRREWSRMAEVKTIETTLLEYGRIPSMIVAQTSKPSSQKQDEGADAEADSKRIEEFRTTIRGMERQGADAIEVDQSLIGNYITDEMSEIIKAQPSMGSALSIEQPTQSVQEMLEEHAQKMEHFEIRKSNFVARKQQLRVEYQDIDSQLAELTANAKSLAEENKKLKAELSEAREIVGQSEHAEDIVRAVTIHEESARDVERFEEMCRREIKEWQQKIADLENASSSETGETDRRLEETLAEFEQEYKRKTELCGVIANKLHHLRTEYDQYPSLIELSQYERRMAELYALTIQKDTDMKKLQQVLNSLCSSGEVLENEDKLFNSIHSTFLKAVNSSDVQKGLVKQLNDIYSQTQTKKNEIRKHLTQQTEEMKRLDQQHRDLLEKQRYYFQIIKQVQEASEVLEQLQEGEN